MTSTDLEQVGSSALAVSDAELAALQAQQAAEIEDDVLQIPLLKIAQPLTREVADGLVAPGEFVNSLTSESVGSKVEFVLSYYQRGRFAADRASGRAFVAFSQEIPEAWADLPGVGEEFVGTPFDEFPDAEEQYKLRVREGEIEWGHGPLVSTTHNFTGFVIVSPEEGTDDAPDFQPVRLALKRSDVPTAKKWIMLAKQKRNRPFWDFVYELSTKRKDFAQGPAHLLELRRGRETSSEERGAAVELAQLVAAGRVLDNSTSTGGDETPVEPEAEGALEV